MWKSVPLCNCNERSWRIQVVATYLTTWKVLFCALLFFAADMVKVILTKIVAGHFHNQLHFSKMEDALNKVCFAQASL